jgi:arsenical pump membrane protein
VAAGLVLAGGGCVATGALPPADAGASLRRILPLLLFLATVIVLAELTAAAGLFDALATRLAIVGRGRYPALFLLCVGLATLTTVLLNLDTTAVLLTPVMLALAGPLRIDPLPAAMTTVWLANTASLLLPVSNLTNLLAADRVALPALGFAGRMWAPELASVAVTAVLLWLCYWRPARRTLPRQPDPPRPPDPPAHTGPARRSRTAARRELARRRYRVPAPHRGARPALLRAAAGACLLFVAGIVAGVPIGLASSAAAAVLVVAFALGDRAVLRPRVIPWRLLVFVGGLFLVVDTIDRHGLGRAVHGLIGDQGGAVGAARAAATGAGLANVVNNLPAYVAGEAAVPAGHVGQLLALLVGTNVGPVILPWASLATLLWYERCRAHAVTVPVRRFVLPGVLLAISVVPAAVAALLVTG